MNIPETGIKIIDDDHSNIASMLGKIIVDIDIVDIDITKERYKNLITETVKHFNNENNLMEVYDYPKYHEHQDIHMKKILELFTLADDLSSSDNKGYHDYQMKTLVSWFYGHIISDDVPLGKFLKEKVK